MSNAKRRRRLRLAQQELDVAIGLLRTAIDKLSAAADHLGAVREEQEP